MKKTIVICSSVAFYKYLIDVEKELLALGFNVVLPDVARKMNKEGNFNVEQQKTWFKNPADYKIKTRLMVDHFEEVKKGDAILVVNYEKKGLQGYIGGNVLMEMVIAFEYKKPIFILNLISEDLPVKEEVYGLQPVFLNRDVSLISKHLSELS
jgi:hypothetical protein